MLLPMLLLIAQTSQPPAEARSQRAVVTARQTAAAYREASARNAPVIASAEDQADTKQNSPSNNPPDPNAETNRRMADYTLVIAWLTGGLFLVGTGQVLIYLSMLRSNHRVERAYLYINKVGPLDGYHAGEGFEVRLTVVNSGSTPARLLRANVLVMHPDVGDIQWKLHERRLGPRGINRADL